MFLSQHLTLSEHANLRELSLFHNRGGWRVAGVISPVNYGWDKDILPPLWDFDTKLKTCILRLQESRPYGLGLH